MLSEHVGHWMGSWTLAYKWLTRITHHNQIYPSFSWSGVLSRLAFSATTHPAGTCMQWTDVTLSGLPNDITMIFSLWKNVDTASLHRLIIVFVLFSLASCRKAVARPCVHPHPADWRYDVNALVVACEATWPRLTLPSHTGWLFYFLFFGHLQSTAKAKEIETLFYFFQTETCWQCLATQVVFLSLATCHKAVGMWPPQVDHRFCCCCANNPPFVQTSRAKNHQLLSTGHAMMDTRPTCSLL